MSSLHVKYSLCKLDCSQVPSWALCDSMESLITQTGPTTLYLLQLLSHCSVLWGFPKSRMPEKGLDAPIYNIMGYINRKNLFSLNEDILYVIRSQFLNVLERSLRKPDFCIPLLPLLKKVVEIPVLFHALSWLWLFKWAPKRINNRNGFITCFENFVTTSIRFEAAAQAEKVKWLFDHMYRHFHFPFSQLWFHHSCSTFEVKVIFILIFTPDWNYNWIFCVNSEILVLR